MMAHKNTATIADISEAQDEIMRELKPPLRLLTTETVLGNPIKSPTPKKYDLSTFSRRKLINWACYRVPMKVVEGIIVPYPFLEAIFYLCPRCHVSMEREYTTFCDRCGQKLD